MLKSRQQAGFFMDVGPNNKKNTQQLLGVFGSGGRNRIRTGVKGFADLCLAARPSDLFRTANIRITYSIRLSDF